MRIAPGLFLILTLGSVAWTGCAPSVAAPSARARAAAAPEALPFIEDDYGRALAEARARHVPLFVDSWAPW